MRNVIIAYKGYTLKSKHEFYWARYFEVEGFDWEYEPVRFGIKGASYTPDFGLNQRTLPIEIKVWGATNVENKFHLCPLPLIIIFCTPDRHYARIKPTNATQLERGRFRHWSLAYQRVAA
jgi:hypothetical protein